jgi:L-rhamnose mutarotase
MSQTQQYCLILTLRDDAELIRQYDEYHQAGNVWPEVIKNICESGILDMQIYRHGEILVLLITASELFSFENMALRDRNNPKVVEWEQLMNRFHAVDDMTTTHKKWNVAKNIFDLKQHLICKG